MKRIYAAYDKVAMVYFTLIVQSHDAPAIRSFSDAILDPKSPWATHPADYELHCLGSFDEARLPCIEGAPSVVVVTGAAVVAQNTPTGEG